MAASLFCANATADISQVLHISGEVDQYFCTWEESDIAHHVTIMCAPENKVMHSDGLMRSTFDDQPPGDWSYWAGIYGVELAHGTGCAFEILSIDGDPRGALFHCL
jgi:hypothetical protein